MKSQIYLGCSYLDLNGQPAAELGPELVKSGVVKSCAQHYINSAGAKAERIETSLVADLLGGSWS
jgi:hypothetical protein